ncbi:4'-phosphopantetheinyl transferase family protein [Paenibacillus lentus]|uniref:4'-phosphopantetheinyl transferase superfamily protein n=1 Tax=Paenibacillus lentus TaxID=1338368 RepID=A0A3Q8S9Z2_9BACL|nr:4'-phosphopantetheinyl transferase superfamily protein [Paenibacillus lentus]AZK45736.1 4'-phosphopantetheinyl transferase superfamily protein [Paenibacillus lentus]
MMEIYGVQLEPNITSLSIWSLIEVLPLERQERIHRFIRKEDALRTLTADILSRLLICSRLNMKNRDICLIQNAYGKPLLKEDYGLHFNNSHSGKWVVCAIDEAPVGIDVEEVKEIDLGLAERFFSKQECIDLHRLQDDNRLSYFFDLWTLKESYIKAAGMGLSLPLDSFSIRVSPERIELNTRNELNCCSFRQYDIDSAYKLSVCAMHDRLPDHIRMLSMDELHKRFMTYV